MIKKFLYQLLLIAGLHICYGADIQQTRQPKKNQLFAPRKKTIDLPEQTTLDRKTISPFPKKIEPEQTAPEELSKIEIEQLKQELEPEVELNFNNASLQNIVDQISQIFDITFIPDDVVKTPGSQVKPLSDSKISFKTNVPFSRKKAWNFFTIFLELAGWSLIPTNDSHVYRITAVEKANKSPLPTYINTSVDILPESDQRIRYVCFLENSTPEQMVGLLKNLTSANAQLDTMPLLRTIIITDVACNIISLLQIIKELDKTSESQILSVINLKEAEATEVVSLIKDLQNKDEPSSLPYGMQKRETSLFYFPKDVSLISAPRTNSLILIGPREGVKRIEHFILTQVDVELKQMYQPVHIYDLNYAPAKQIADILNSVVQFGKKSGGGSKEGGPTAGEAGGVIGGLKYFGDIFIEPEEQGNRLLIRSNQEDWIHLSKIIDQLDKRQQQVAIEVMIVEISFNKTRQLGVQWQTKNPATIEGQMSGFFGSKAQVATNASPPPYTNTLLANLINLAKVPEAGTMLLTLGKESVYAILGLLDKNVQTRMLANPFIVATNKYTSTVAISETRRAQTQIVGENQAGNQSFDAKLQVSIMPQINEFGLINLDINVIIENFLQDVSGTSANNANKTTRQVQTNANVADKEVLALGGLVQRKKTVTTTRIPILSRIPLIGNIFKNEYHNVIESHLVIFMSPTIIQPTDVTSNLYTRNKSQFMTMLSRAYSEKYERSERDPIYRWFFKEVDGQDMSDDIETFIAKGTKKQPTPDEPKANIITQSVENKKEGAS